MGFWEIYSLCSLEEMAMLGGRTAIIEEITTHVVDDVIYRSRPYYNSLELLYLRNFPVPQNQFPIEN